MLGYAAVGAAVQAAPGTNDWVDGNEVGFTVSIGDEVGCLLIEGLCGSAELRIVGIFVGTDDGTFVGTVGIAVGDDVGPYWNKICISPFPLCVAAEPSNRQLYVPADW